MVEIKCLVCKKSMGIPSCTKLEDYDGQLFCCECNLLWDVKFKSSELKKYKLAKQQPKVKPATMNIIVKDDEARERFNRLLRGKKPAQIPQDVVVKEDEQ